MLNARDERGSAPVEMVFAIVLLMLLMLGVIQVAFALYARNVVAASAHEGARAALERGRSVSDVESIAREVATRAAGKLVEELRVDVAADRVAGRWFVRVRVSGTMAEFGPIPIKIPLLSTATAQMDEETRR